MAASPQLPGHLLSSEGIAAGRADWVDAAKGLAIVLVVLHHVVIPLDGAQLLPPVIADVNYTLATSRMPMLFLISGLFAGRALSRPWGVVLRRRISHYTWLYIVWSVITLAVEGLLLQEVRLDEVAGVLLRWTVAPGSSLWFVYGLAVFSVLTKLVQRVPATVVVLVALVLAVVVESTAALAGAGFAWQRFAELFVFFVMGARWGPFLRRAAEEAPKWAWAVVSVVAATWGAVASAFDLHRWAFVTLLQSILFVAAAVLVCARSDGSRVSRGAAWLGARTLPIYLIHGLVVAGAVRGAPATGREVGEVATTLSLLLAVAALIASSLVLHAALVRAGAGWLFALPRRWAHPVSGAEPRDGSRAPLRAVARRT